MKHNQPFSVSERHNRWSTTSGSSYVRHPSPRAGHPRSSVESAVPLTPRAAFDAAMAARSSGFAPDDAGHHSLNLGTAGAARAVTPPPGGGRASSHPTSSFAQFVGAAASDKPIFRGKRAISSRCTEDHIVFENTKYEYPDDPSFYAKHRPELELPVVGGARWPGYVSPDGHVHYDYPAAEEWRESGGYGLDGYDDGGANVAEDTDFAARVLLHGFPGKQRGVTRRKALTGAAQEKTHDLFAEQDAAALDGLSYSQSRSHPGQQYSPLPQQQHPAVASSPLLGADGRRRSRRHLIPQPQSMSNSFQAVGDEVPYFRGGKKVSEQRVAGDYDQTLRVLRTDLQDEPGPFRAHVRVGYTPGDSLDYTLQGSALPERQTRRAFFEIRR